MIGFGQDKNGENPWYIDRTKPSHWYLEGQDIIIVDLRGNFLEVYLEKADWGALYVYHPGDDNKTLPNYVDLGGIFLVGPKREESHQMELDLGD